ncbi:sacsin N-terminal ATP-binding-like domain-containing protein [Archangium lansingense]|uniref:DUF3883 domain-containing protein n=1 Tax=Archangium lansingense TaxID=2995310 RepID=UPI003B7CE23F
MSLVAKLRDEWLEKAVAGPEFLEELSRLELGTTQEYAGRWPFELIQNSADSVQDAERDDGHVRFVLIRQPDSASLLVANNGHPFTEADLRAVCRLGKSSKNPTRSIGHKGLGFKSVLAITSRPFVWSGELVFRFSREDTIQELAHRAPGSWAPEAVQILRVPFPASLDELDAEVRAYVDDLITRGSTTVMHFPLKVPPESVEQDLQQLDPRLLLFLPSIATISISDGARTRELHKSKSEEQIILHVDDKEDSRWIARKREVEVPTEIRDSIEDASWREVERVGITLALPIDADGVPRPNPVQPLFIYLPTEEKAGLALAIHANFYPDPARKGVLAHRYNEWLADRISEFMSDELIGLVRERWPGSARGSLALLPRGAPLGFGEALARKIQAQLKTQKVVLTEQGDWVLPGKAALSPEGADSKRFREILRLKTEQRDEALVHSELELDEWALKFLSEAKARPLALETAADMVTRAVAAVASPGVVYRFLSDWWHRHPSRERFIKTLATRRLVRCEGGRLEQPDREVFHPRGRGDAGKVPDIVPVRVVDPVCYDGDESGDVRNFLSRLGVRDYSYREIIQQAVVPLFHKERPQLSDPELFSVLRYLFTYWSTTQGGDRDVKAQIGRITVPCYATESGPRMRAPASQVFFGKRWGHPLHEEAFGGLEAALFLDDCPELVVPNEDRGGWLAFFIWLGVNPGLAIDKEAATYASSLQRHPSAGEWGWSSYATAMDARLPCVDHPLKVPRLGETYHLRFFSALVQRGERKRLAAFFQLLAQHWPQCAFALDMSVTCSHGWCPSPKKTWTIPSYLAWSLRNAPWIPTQVADMDEPAPRRPREVWHLGKIPGFYRIRSFLPTLPPELASDTYGELCAFLRVVEPTNAEVQDYLNLLSHLERIFPGEIPEDDRRAEQLLNLFRWIAEKLGDLLAEQDTSTQPAGAPPPPIPARLKRQVVWRPPQDVFYADDPGLAERWSNVCPLLSLGEDSAKVRALLNIRKLDSDVDRLPVAGEELTEETAGLQRELNDVLPAFLALASMTQPTRTMDRVLPRLRRLDMAVVQCLLILERLKVPPGGEREYEAPAHIAQSMGAHERGGRAIQGRLLVAAQARREKYVFAAEIGRYVELERLTEALTLLLTLGPQERAEYLHRKGVRGDLIDRTRRMLRPTGEESDNWEATLESDMLSGLSGAPPAAPLGAGSTGAGASGNAPPPTTTALLEETGQGPQAPAPAQALPPLQAQGITLSNYQPGSFKPPSQGNGGQRGGGTGGNGGPVDWESLAQNQRSDGQRGEEAVFLAEQRRLLDAGRKDLSERVRWVAKENELSDHDIESFDETTGTPIIIEVKATAQDSLRFPITIAELRLAAEKRDRYYLYRVTHVREASPRIHRIRDPFGLFLAGQLHLNFKDLYVELPAPLEDSMEPEPETS